MVLIAASGLILIGAFVVDFIRWHRAVRIRVGWAAGLVGVALLVAAIGVANLMTASVASLIWLA